MIFGLEQLCLGQEALLLHHLGVIQRTLRITAEAKDAELHLIHACPYFAGVGLCVAQLCGDRKRGVVVRVRRGVNQ